MHSSKSSNNPPDTTSIYSEDAPEPMQFDKAYEGRTLRTRKEKVAKHMKRGANEKEMDSFTKKILRIPLDKPFEEAYFPTGCGCSSARPRRLRRTLGECSIRSERR